MVRFILKLLRFFRFDHLFDPFILTVRSDVMTSTFPSIWIEITEKAQKTISIDINCVIYVNIIQSCTYTYTLHLTSINL